ncbi:MAG: LPP20 family lipoprotein [Proteobacteria bacterium]|nr:LPP20 family lipoprotein [Pseudomonadota bacterium]
MKKRQRTTAGIRIRPLVLLVLLGLVFACGKGSSFLPETGTTLDFPETRFLLAQGTGATEIDARRQALAELSAIFDSRVSSRTESLARSSLGPDNTELFEKTLESRIQILSSVRLEGAKIGKVWQDEAPGTFHALAVLDRKDAGRKWTRDLEILDQRIGAETSTLGTTPGKLGKMAALNQILDLSLERHAIESRLVVVNYPVLPESELDLGKMMSQLAAIRSSLHFYIDIPGEYGQMVETVLSQTLTRNGILITPDRDKADAWVMGQVVVTPINLDNLRAVFVRATGKIQVVDTDSHALFAEMNQAVRKGHLDRNEAIHKAVLEVSQQISRELVQALGLGETYTKEHVQ